MPYTYYSARIEERGMSRTCSHLHGTMSEALDCASGLAGQAGVRDFTVVAADEAPDGVSRRRDLTASEQEQLDGLLNRGDA